MLFKKGPTPEKWTHRGSGPGATALSVTFAGTAVATAAEEPTTLSSSSEKGAATHPYANGKGANNNDDRSQ
ncbi:hypothetical protein [Corynebacterium macginleyi]|uniref:hypothetical protein n=1 Tax=Corynebacterium macginleyi TaxID=38290 RepID=UPI001F26D099|nr:hypothetical protein [Corynebacterium macginleyi]